MPRYRVIEVDRHGSTHWEEFDAPNDKTALKRVWDEVRGQWFQLWRDGELIHEGRPKRSGPYAPKASAMAAAGGNGSSGASLKLLHSPTASPASG